MQNQKENDLKSRNRCNWAYPFLLPCMFRYFPTYSMVCLAFTVWDGFCEGFGLGWRWRLPHTSQVSRWSLDHRERCDSPLAMPAMDGCIYPYIKYIHQPSIPSTYPFIFISQLLCLSTSLSSSLSTPWKINMEHTNHPFRKEIDLPDPHDYVPC